MPSYVKVASSFIYCFLHSSPFLPTPLTMGFFDVFLKRDLGRPSKRSHSAQGSSYGPHNRAAIALVPDGHGGLRPTNPQELEELMQDRHRRTDDFEPRGSCRSHRPSQMQGGFAFEPATGMPRPVSGYNPENPVPAWMQKQQQQQGEHGGGGGGGSMMGQASQGPPSMGFNFEPGGIGPGSHHPSHGPSHHSQHQQPHHSQHQPVRTGKLPEGARLPTGIQDPFATVSAPKPMGHYGMREHVPGMSRLNPEKHGKADDPLANWHVHDEIRKLKEGLGGGGGGNGGYRGSKFGHG